MRIAHVTAAEIEIGEEKYDQRRGEDRFACRAPELLGARGKRKHFIPESEVDAYVTEHRPCERRGGGEHDRAFDDEENRQKEREQPGNADDDAVIEREGVDLALV